MNMNEHNNTHRARMIRSELALAGVRQIDIAKKIGAHPVSVHDVIAGKRPNKRIREAIACAIGKTVSEVFTDAE